MAEEDLKKAIQQRIQREREAILNQARREAEEVLSQARCEAASLQDIYLAEIKKNCLFKKARELNQINSAVKKEFLEAKEKKILEVLSSVKERLKTVYQDKAGYKPIFRSLLLEALSCFDKSVKLRLKVNLSDKELALELIKELKLDTQLEALASIEGGLKLCDSEEKIIILNTFESRLNKFIHELRQEISKILFG